MGKLKLFKKNIFTLLFGEFRNTILICTIIAILPAIIFMLPEDFLPSLATYKIMTLTYREIIGFNFLISFLSSAANIYMAITLNRTQKAPVYNNAKTIFPSKRIHQYSKEISQYKKEELSDRKKAFINKLFFVIAFISVISGLIISCLTLNTTFRLFNLTMLITGIFLFSIGFYIRNSSKKIPLTSKKYNATTDNTKRLNLFTSNIWLFCGTFLISVFFLKSNLFLVSVIIISLFSPYLFSYVIRDKGGESSK